MAETPPPSPDTLTPEQIVTPQTDPRRQLVQGDILLNPDEVLQLQSRREGIAVYMKAEQETHLAAVLYARYLAVTSREWDILPASEEQQDLAIAAFVKEVLLATNFDEGRQHLLKAIHRGYSVCELQWQVRDQDGAIVLRQWLARPPYRFIFDTDEQLRVLTRAQPTKGEAVPQHKFQVFSWGDEYGTPYGAGLGSQTYYPNWFKREIQRFWLIFADKYGMPTPWASYPGNTPSQVIDRIQAAVTAIHSETALLLPDTVSVKMLESARSDASQVYETAMRYQDSLVTKLVQGQTLTTEQGTPGSLALGQVHMDVRREITKADSDALAEALNGLGGVIRTLVDFNYPNVQAYPTYWVNFEQSEDLNAKAERDERLVKSGVQIPARYFYETYTLPRPEAGEEVVTAPASGGLGFAAPPRFASPARMAQADSQQAGRLLEATSPFVRAVGDDLTAHILTWSEQSMGSLRLLQITLPTLSATLDMTALAEHLYPCVLESQLLGQAQIAAEPVAFALVEDLPFAILDPEEAIAFFSELLDLTEPEWTALLRGIFGLVRTVADDQRAMVTALVGQEVLTALEAGSTLREFQDRVTAMFKDELAGTSPGKAQLETVFRTNMMEAYQVGRYEQMTAMVSVRPYWQYHAIPDSRVRPTHLAQNGKVYRADHPFWSRWMPPNGFNCRCTVVALAESELEEFGLTPETADAPEDPDEGFRQNVGERWQSRR